jgi:hypothetical protein
MKEKGKRKQLVDRGTELKRKQLADQGIERKRHMRSILIHKLKVILGGGKYGSILIIEPSSANET